MRAPGDAAFLDAEFVDGARQDRDVRACAEEALDLVGVRVFVALGARPADGGAA